eukprot:c17723_g1_i1.p1 GENE.c17723_g1_i1~~c17723_g1_i1.p1  ORF type:complete len:528 (-),score=126.86 c17723_g1_i1:16-1551(-)
MTKFVAERLCCVFFVLAFAGNGVEGSGACLPQCGLRQSETVASLTNVRNSTIRHNVQIRSLNDMVGDLRSSLIQIRSDIAGLRSKLTTLTDTCDFTGCPSYSSSPSASPSRTASSSTSPSSSASPSATPSKSATASRSSTSSPSATASVSSTASPSSTRTASASSTASPSKSATPSVSPTASVSNTASVSASPSPSSTASPSSTPSVSSTRSVSPTASVSPTRSVSPTSSVSATASVSRTASSSQSATSSVSATASVSASPTRSASPSSSASSSSSATASVSPTASVSATSSVSASPTSSKSNTPSPSASPSPSGTPGYQLGMYTEDGSCKTAGCVNTKPDDPQTARVMITVQRIIPSQYEPNCTTTDGGSLSAGYCITNINVRNVTDYALADINYYNHITNTVLVKWKTDYTPTITNPNVYPNTLMPVPAIAMVVNCTSTPYPTLYRVGWKYGATNNGPCYTDPLYLGFHCVPSGLNTNLNKYVDSTGNQMTTGTRYKDLICPDQTGAGI